MINTMNLPGLWCEGLTGLYRLSNGFDTINCLLLLKFNHFATD